MLRISPRQIDRRLAAQRRQLRKRLYGRTKPGTLLKHHIPLKTDRWDVAVPGFTEIDLVAHCGNCGDGEFVHSLNLTDIHTTWVETRAVLGKGQVAVQTALEEIRQALPFRLRGIDSDNGSEFINEHLWDYCQAQEIQFTRGRPYKKDDNAHIEQKNWTHVRKLLGYVRYDTPAALAAIQTLYRGELRLFQNLFLPSVKLVRKERVGARVRRRYDAPQTPLDRVLAVPGGPTGGGRAAAAAARPPRPLRPGAHDRAAARADLRPGQPAPFAHVDSARGRARAGAAARATPGPQAPQYSPQSNPRAPRAPGNIEDGAMMRAKVTSTNGLTGGGEDSGGIVWTTSWDGFSCSSSRGGVSACCARQEAGVPHLVPLGVMRIATGCCSLGSRSDWSSSWCYSTTRSSPQFPGTRPRCRRRCSPWRYCR